MKKRLIGTLLLGALFVSSTSVFVSCKDYDDDINSLSSSIQKLESEVAQKEAAINSAISDLRNITSDLETNYKAADKQLQQSITDLENTHKADINKVTTNYEAADAVLRNAITALETTHDNDVKDLKAKDALLDEAIIKAEENAIAAAKLLDEATNKRIDNVVTDLNNVKVTIGHIQDSVKNAYAEIDRLDAALIAQKAELLEKINKNAEDIQTNAGNISKNADAIKDIVENKIPQLQQDLKDAKTELKGEIAAAEGRVTDALNTAKARITKNEEDIVQLGKDIEAINKDLNVINKILSGDLRSLVFMPYAYVDGIEAIMYPWFTIEEYLTNNTLYSGEEKFNRGVRYGETQDAQQNQTTKPGAYLTIPAGTDWVIDPTDGVSANKPVIYLPEIGVDYHMNPATANTQYKDLIGFVQRDTRYTETSTRAAGDLVVLAEKNEKSGYNFWKNKDGVLSTGLLVTNLEKLLAMENYIVALQAKTSINDANITSDYAEVYPEHITKLSISWARDNDRTDIDGTCPPDSLDEKCEGILPDTDPYHKVSARAKHQVYDTPKEALLHSASVFVEFDNEKGVSLGSYLQTCFDREGHQGGDKYHAAWPFGEEEKYGFKYEFKLMPYIHEKNLNDGSGTNTGAIVMDDMKYAKLVGDTIIATNKDGGKATETSIGREPLVRVLLKHGDRVVKDGWILCRIYSEHSDSIVYVEKYSQWTKNYDNCNGLTFVTPTMPDKRGDFDKLIIKELLNNEFDFLTFNGLYNLDGGLDNATIYTSNTEVGDDATKYEYTKRDGSKEQIAKISLTPVRTNGTSGKFYSYSFKIEMTPAQVEAVTHDQNSASITPSFYIRWTRKNVRAPYKHIYMRLQVTINRSIQITGISDKLDNYWYGLNGARTGWDALAFNVGYPQDNSPIDNWSNSTLKAFDDQEVKFTTSGLSNKDRKFFFTPQNTTIKDLEGTEWIITPAKGDADYLWKTLVCEKDVKDSHIWPLTKSDSEDRFRIVNNDASATDVDSLKNMMTWCNFAYNAGVFNDTVLYAVKKSEYHNCDPLYSKAYTKIAEMDPETGEITLIRNWNGDNNTCAQNNELDMILNAVGYAAEHANLTKQLHAWTSVVGDNGCNVAMYTFDKKDDNNKTFSIWASSWERPINLVNDKPKDEFNAVKDAQSNGYYIPIYDLLAFYDWRGPVEGDMEAKNNKWLWAYYNINRIEADLNPDHVTTTLHGGTLAEFGNPDKPGTALSSFTGEVRLYPATAAQRSAVKAATAYTFNTLIGKASGNWNAKTVSENLVNYLEGTQNGKANFGYIFYENNGLNVDEFIVRIPMVIYYEWGHFRTYVDVKINTTLGN